MFAFDVCKHTFAHLFVMRTMCIANVRRDGEHSAEKFVNGTTNDSIGNRRGRLLFFFSLQITATTTTTIRWDSILESHLICYILHYARAQSTEIVGAIVCLAAPISAAAAAAAAASKTTARPKWAKMVHTNGPKMNIANGRLNNNENR